MDEIRYMISEAAKRVDVEAHVLRYWQKELTLPISRNEMEQRYYKESDVELFKRVKHLKEQGYQLKAIKMLMENESIYSMFDSSTGMLQKEDNKGMELMQEDKQEECKEGTSLITEESEHVINEETDSKMSQFKSIMNQIILSALRENNEILSSEISTNVTEGVTREMSYLMKIQEEKEEERFKKFDAALRDYQKSRQMAAATINTKKKKSKFFKKNKVYI